MESTLLLEYRPIVYDRSLINEAIHSEAPVVLSGIFQEANSLNQNGRIYPKEVLAREVDKFQQLIAEGRAYGALDHPDSSIVELSNAAILVRELNWNNNQVVGKLEVLNTSKGKDLKAILEAGGKIGISSRSFGSTRRTNEGNEVVNDDLNLITFDAVASPSVAKAILTESYRKIEAKIDRKVIIENILDEILKR